MKRERFRILAAALCVAFAAAIPLRSGITGKVAGRVTDQSTGEPYFGANVVLVGTTLGAGTDKDGFFTVLQVPPGVYSVQVRAMGYKSVTVTDIQVRIDQTSSLDFRLEQEAIPGESVTIHGKREAVKQDVATSVSSFAQNEIQQLAVTKVQDLVELQAGVEKGMVIRGGSENEMLFQVNGITLRDPRNNKPITGVALNAIQEVAMERGGFNAEYGQVRSGIVNVVTREGGKDRYSGGITIKASPPAAKQFGPSVFDRNSMWMKPYLDEAVCWTGTSGWDKYTTQQYPEFRGWNKVSEELLSDSDPTNDLTPKACQRLFEWEHRKMPITDQPDYNIDAGFGGPVPFIGKQLGDLRFFGSFKRDREMLLIPLTRDDYKEDNWMMQVTSDIRKNMKLTATTYGGQFNAAVANFDPDGQNPGYLNNQFGPNDTRVARYWMPTLYLTEPLAIAQVSNEQRAGRMFGNSWYSNSFVRHYGSALKFTHTFNAKTFYEARLEYITTRYTTGPVEQRDLTPAQLIIPANGSTPAYYANEAPFGFDVASVGGVGGAINIFGGHSAQSRDTSRISAYSLKIDLTSQLNHFNLVKTGMELVYNDLNLFYGVINNFTGLHIVNKEHKFPIRGALYAQDKLETKGFVIHAGLRMDYSNANTRWVKPLDPFDASFYSSNYLYNKDVKFKTEKAKADISLSPRLGISHPITENSKLYFNYGHFKQLPTYEEIIRTGRGAGGEMQNYGDPNLALAKTVSYELGYDQLMFGQEGLLIQTSAFYHDISNQQAYTLYTSADGKVSYSVANNDNYADIRGFELTLRKPAGWLSGFANYTYQVSSYGYFGNPFVFQSITRQRDSDTRTRTTFLYQQKPVAQPYARGSLVLHSPMGFGPSVLKANPLEDWTLNLLFNWKAGEFITWNPFNKADVVSNVQVADAFNFSLRLNKTIPVLGMKYTFFIEVDNLLNTKRLSGAGFYDYNDYIAYMQSLHLSKSRNNDYTNIPGSDRIGEYRDPSIAYQPIEQVGIANDLTNPDPKAIYYETTTRRYLEYANSAWQQVETGRMDKVLKNKAYIDMPNQSYFNFLYPRQIFFGITVTF
jgi:hypothetical protein